MNIKTLLLNHQKYFQKEIEINGWLRTVRKQKNLHFMSINDGSTSKCLQVICDLDNTDESLKEKFKNLLTGYCLTVSGIMVESPAKGQDIEMQLKKMVVNGSVDESYPFAKTRMNLETIRNYQHLRCRTKAFGCIFRIKSSITHATHDFYRKEGYLHLDPNVITTNECEGGAGVFQVTEKDISKLSNLKFDKKGDYIWKKDHFNKPTFLTVSSQLNLEALSCGLGPVYTTNKSFRSEHSSTNKHLSEFTHLEIENCFIDLNYLMDISERYIKFIAHYLLENNKDDLNELNKFVSKGIVKRVEELKDCKFHKITHRESISLLKENNFECNYDDDLSSEMEHFLTEHFKGPVFVTHWPLKIKSFYMRQCDDGTCESFDLLMPFKVGEMIGGSMREERYEKLVKKMEEKGLDLNIYSFYTDLRKYGSAVHGGFGLGLDRMCMLFTGMENIRDVIPFPISYKSCNY